MNVLVDSSVWVGHFKQRNEHLITRVRHQIRNFDVFHTPVLTKSST